jgi:N-acetylmuramic acid 6-phosphate etherase
MSQTEAISPRYHGLDTWSDGDILDAFWEGQARAIAAVRAAEPAIARAAEVIVARLKRAGRLIYVGAGSSGRLAAVDGAELASTFGWPEARTVFLLAEGPVLAPGASGAHEDDVDCAREAIRSLGVTGEDVVIAVAASGRTPFTLAAAEEAHALGALVVAIVNNPGAPLLARSDVGVVIETGAEIISGSTRMNAGTAQKAALGLLSSLVMTRLGHVYDGLMINLRAENAKLRERALGILAQITGASRDQATRALEICQGHIKPAALVVQGASPEEAERLLRETGGNLRAALLRIAGTG